MKNSIVRISLFLCLVAPVLLTYSWLHHQKHLVRKSVKRQIIAGIDIEDLVTIKLSKKEVKTQLHWKHSKEFEYKGEMYDIVKTDTIGDTLVYHCWWDYEETSLNRQLSRLAVDAWNQNPQRKEKEAQLNRLFKNLFSPSEFTATERIPTFIKPFYTPYCFYYSNYYSSPPAPPPRIG